MIVGIGTDLVSVERFRRALTQKGFAERAFTGNEIAAAVHFRDPSEHFAGRWAAKEALAKALGTGFGEACHWQEIEIMNGSEGRPEMTLCGGTLETFRRLGGTKLWVSITHEHEFASAFVVMEKE